MLSSSHALARAPALVLILVLVLGLFTRPRPPRPRPPRPRPRPAGPQPTARSPKRATVGTARTRSLPLGQRCARPAAVRRRTLSRVPCRPGRLHCPGPLNRRRRVRTRTRRTPGPGVRVRVCGRTHVDAALRAGTDAGQGSTAKSQGHAPDAVAARRADLAISCSDKQAQAGYVRGPGVDPSPALPCLPGQRPRGRQHWQHWHTGQPLPDPWVRRAYMCLLPAALSCAVKSCQSRPKQLSAPPARRGGRANSPDGGRSRPLKQRISCIGG